MFETTLHEHSTSPRKKRLHKRMQVLIDEILKYQLNYWEQAFRRYHIQSVIYFSKPRQHDDNTTIATDDNKISTTNDGKRSIHSGRASSSPSVVAEVSSKNEKASHVRPVSGTSAHSSHNSHHDHSRSTSSMNPRNLVAVTHRRRSIWSYIYCCCCSADLHGNKIIDDPNNSRAASAGRKHTNNNSKSHEFSYQIDQSNNITVDKETSGITRVSNPSQKNIAGCWVIDGDTIGKSLEEALLAEGNVEHNRKNQRDNHNDQSNRVSRSSSVDADGDLQNAVDIYLTRKHRQPWLAFTLGVYRLSDSPGCVEAVVMSRSSRVLSPEPNNFDHIKSNQTMQTVNRQQRNASSSSSAAGSIILTAPPSSVLGSGASHGNNIVDAMRVLSLEDTESGSYFFKRNASKLLLDKNKSISKQSAFGGSATKYLCIFGNSSMILSLDEHQSLLMSSSFEAVLYECLHDFNVWAGFSMAEKENIHGSEYHEIIAT